MELRRGDDEEWQYFREAGRLILLYTVLPLLLLGVLALFLWAVL